jgi:hypothetical protein
MTTRTYQHISNVTFWLGIVGGISCMLLAAASDNNQLSGRLVLAGILVVTAIICVFISLGTQAVVDERKEIQNKKDTHQALKN